MIWINGPLKLYRVVNQSFIGFVGSHKVGLHIHIKAITPTHKTVTQFTKKHFSCTRRAATVGAR